MSSEETASLPFGPVQLLVLAFDRTQFNGEVMPELQRLKEQGTARLIDLIFVRKENGQVETMQASDLSTDEAEEFGALVGALIGAGMGDEETVVAGLEMGAEAGADGHVIDENEVWYLADAVPEGMSAAVVLLEHLWAIPLRDAIVDAGGIALADEWIHPKDLIAVGVAAAAE
jgi:uncharacterized membrane protein